MKKGWGPSKKRQKKSAGPKTPLPRRKKQIVEEERKTPNMGKSMANDFSFNNEERGKMHPFVKKILVRGRTTQREF